MHGRIVSYDVYFIYDKLSSNAHCLIQEFMYSWNYRIEKKKKKKKKNKNKSRLHLASSRNIRT